MAKCVRNKLSFLVVGSPGRMVTVLPMFVHERAVGRVGRELSVDLIYVLMLVCVRMIVCMCSCLRGECMCACVKVCVICVRDWQLAVLLLYVCVAVCESLCVCILS